MRAIIADDEELIRFSIRDMLDEVPGPVTVLGEAGNGIDLVELCERLHPDVAIVDVRMPKMDGLEAIELLRKSCPNTEWIVLTSYSEFDYARRALSAGVVDYLLKPVGPNELAEALDRVRERRADHLRSGNLDFENQVTALLSGIEREAEETEWEGWQFAAALLSVDSFGNSPRHQLVKKHVSHLARERMSDLVKSTTRYSVSTLTDDSIAAVFGWQDSSLETGTARSLAERYVNRLVSIGPELGVEGRGVTMFLADDSMPFSEIAVKLERVRALSPLRVLSGFGTSARLSELESISSIEGSRELAASLLAAAAALRERRPLGLEQNLKVAARLLRETPSLQTPHLLQNIERYLTLLLGFEVGPMNRLDEWFPLLRDVLIANREGSREAGGGGVSMRQVIDFLEENFMKEISIAGVAVSLGLTPNYLSALFHKRVGTTFTKYLTRLRMDRARELLTGSERSVGEVAAAVGYASTRHFARTFKETFGSYPSELKRSSRG